MTVRHEAPAPLDPEPLPCAHRNGWVPTCPYCQRQAAIAYAAMERVTDDPGPDLSNATEHDRRL